MKILIIYGTVEGQTRKIARFMEDVLQSQGHQVVLADATEEPPAPTAFDVVLIGSSIHVQQYNAAVKDYILQYASQLSSRPSAFYSVCMAVASGIPEEHEEVAKLAQAFVEETGWNTQEIWHFAGALKYTQYNYFKKLVMRMIAKKQGGATDTAHDYEYTDWKAVEATVSRYIDHLSQGK